MKGIFINLGSSISKYFSIKAERFLKNEIEDMILVNTEIILVNKEIKKVNTKSILKNTFFVIVNRELKKLYTFNKKGLSKMK